MSHVRDAAQCLLEERGFEVPKCNFSDVLKTSSGLATSVQEQLTPMPTLTASEPFISSLQDKTVERQWVETAKKDQELIEKMVAQGGSRWVMDDAETKLIQTKFSDAIASPIKQSQKAVDRTEALRKECRNNGK